MIRLDRGDAPEFFKSPVVEQLRQESASFFALPASKRSQLKFDFQRVAARMYPSVRHLLKQRFVSKCAYCETPVENPDIEAFRPKQRATNLDGRVDDEHYWWLTFEWANYLPACRQCNSLKGPRFPVDGARAKVGTVGKALSTERRLLLDPCEDDPASVLLFLDDGRVTSDAERGRVTIDVIGLNRAGLVEARRSDLRFLLKRLANAKGAVVTARDVSELVDMAQDASPFAAMRRQYIRAWATDIQRASPSAAKLVIRLLQHKTALADIQAAGRRKAMVVASSRLDARGKKAESYDIESKVISTDFYRQARFIQKIELQNIRAIEQLDLQLPIGETLGGDWFILLGENGTGKSSILQAVACALVGQKGIERLTVRATDFIRHGCSTGEVRIHLTGMSVPIVMKLLRRGNRITIDPPEPKVMVLAYGATRLLRDSPTQTQNKSRVNIQNLFDPYARLSNGKPWLYEAKKSVFDRFARSLSALLPRSDGARFVRRRREIYIETPGASDTLSRLSSGYQAVLALALDIMGVMRLGWQDMDSAEGIVLIDEIDAHLHPRWKMRIIQRLREVFPRLQFIATSHEPLTLRSLEANEVAVLKRSLSGNVTVINSQKDDIPSPRLMRVDQILTSELFGLHSAENMDVDAQFEEYYTLLSRRTRTSEQSARLEELAGSLGSVGHMGSTPRERLVFEAADAFLAQRKSTKEGMSSTARSAAQRRLQSIWADIKSPVKSTFTKSRRRET